MRILFVSDAPSTHTRKWAEYFRKKGCEVHVASFRPDSMEGVTVHCLPTFKVLGKLSYPAAVFALRSLFRNLKPDIVHAQYVTSYGFLSALARLRPLVITAWGTDVLISPKESKASRMLVRYALERADAVTTVAEHMNSSVTPLLPPGKRVEAIPFGVDASIFAMEERPVKREGRLELVSTRNFAPIYDVATLVKALSIVKGKGVDIRTRLIGDGPLRQELETLVADLGMGGEICFLGHISQERLARELNGADIFVTTALSDGNNVSLNEAMACGAFPIATSIPANLQWIEDGKNGLIYSPGNPEALAMKIIDAVNKPALREKARAVNRLIIEERAEWRVCVKRMEKIYEDLTGLKI